MNVMSSIDETGLPAAANGDTKRAWTTTIFAMLQDIRVAFF